jgi:hypothetical protein
MPALRNALTQIHRAEEDARGERAKTLNLAQYLSPYRKQRMWLDAHLQLLGTTPDTAR